MVVIENVPHKIVYDSKGNVKEKHYKIIIEKQEVDGTSSVQPDERSLKDKSTVYFQNIDPELKSYVKFKNGITIPIRYIPANHERGFFICTSYQSLKEVKEDAVIEEFGNSLEKRKLFDTEEIKVVTSRFTDVDGGAGARSFLSDHQSSFSDRLIDFKKFLRSVDYYREYSFVSLSEVQGENFFVLENQQAMIILNDPTLPYPTSDDFDKVNSGVAITIRDSKNPTKCYYTNILGSVVSIPVKRDNKKADGITVVKTFKGQDEVTEYSLEQASEIGIFENYVDAENNCDIQQRIDLLKSEAALKGIDQDMLKKEVDLRVAEIKAEMEEEKRNHELEKMRLEKDLKEKDAELSRAKELHEILMRKYEIASEELKRKTEEKKFEATSAKSYSDATSSAWKTIGAVVAGVVTVAMAVMKFFF